MYQAAKAIRSGFIVGLAICASLTPLASRAADRTIEVIAVTGQQAPGTADGVVFSDLEFPAINSSGTLAFSADLSGPGVLDENDEGIWSGSTKADLDLLARSGEAVEGASLRSPFFPIFSSPVVGINDAGQVLSAWSFQDGSFNHETGSGFWVLEPGTSPREVVRTGTVAPGGDGGVFDSIGVPTAGLFFPAFDTPVFNNQGHAAFVGLTDTAVSGFYSEGTGSVLAPIATDLQHAPGYSSEVTFNEFSPFPFFLSWPTLNDHGESAFWSSVTGPGVVRDENDSGIWMHDAGGQLRLVAAAGQAIAEELGGGSFGGLNIWPTLNNSGDVSFLATLDDPTDPESIILSLWVDRRGTGLDLVAKTGDAAPGVPGRATFDSFLFDLPNSLNAAGESLFVATLEGDDLSADNRVGIWTDAGGEGLRLVARSGDLAPGAGPNVRLSFEEFTVTAFNAAGQTAFVTELVGDGVDATNDASLWIEDAPGELDLILRKGEQLDVGDGDFRTVRDFFFFPSFGNQDGRTSAFNELGWLALHVDFDDGSEAIVLVIPEPSAWMLAWIGAAAALGFLRKSDAEHCRRR